MAKKMPSHLISKSKTNIFEYWKQCFWYPNEKTKDYYTELISKKAKFSNNSLVLKRDFSLNEDQLRKVFLLPHMVCSEAYALRPFNIRSLTLFYIPIPNYIRLDTLQTINALFVSLNQKPYCNFFLTAYTQSFSGKILNFTFTRCRKNLFILIWSKIRRKQQW